MIFVTVGSMFPFNRLIQEMDAWAKDHPDEDVFAQIGDGTYEPVHMKFVRRLKPPEFADTVKKADVTVAHAGTGSVITASDLRRPVVIMPRLAKLGEHTTNHQVDTANWLKDRPGVFVAADGTELDARIREARQAEVSEHLVNPSADTQFLERIRQALND